MKINAYIPVIISLLLTGTTLHEGKQNPYNLKIITNIAAYDSLVKQDSNQKLVNLEQFIPGIVLDIRYATKNNFTKKVLYSHARAFARLPVAVALRQVQQDLSKHKLGLKIYDAYRPYSVTLHLYETCPDSTYLASPRTGSIHNRGCAVDVSLVNLQTGIALQMPTAYDDFSEKAWFDYMELPENAIRNRKMLQELMISKGFEIFPSEWWHFNYKERSSFDLLNLNFEELE